MGIESLDLINAPAPLAPELAMKEDLHGKEREKKLKTDKASVSLEEDVVHNDFKREKMLEKEQGQQRSEKIAKLRELKKFGKKVQIEVQQKRQKEKKDMMDEMKKVRKGQGGNLDFLDEGGQGGPKKNAAVAAKRNFKDKKFGFGGKKRGLKKNDKKSADDVSSFKPFNKGGSGPNKKLGKGKLKRPGKDKRQKMKNKKKK